MRTSNTQKVRDNIKVMVEPQFYAADRQELTLAPSMFIFYEQTDTEAWAICGEMIFFLNPYLTFFPPCFSTMSVLRGKWSSWGVLAPPPLGIVQLSPRQASFTLPMHRHQLSRTKEERSTVLGGVTSWPIHVFENSFVRQCSWLWYIK